MRLASNPTCHSRSFICHSRESGNPEVRVLVTCGPTWAAIDDVRVISNISTGEMGHLIAQAFKAKGAQVTLLEGQVTHSLNDQKIKVIKYRFFDELAALLKKELNKKYDIMVHAAAVSDFKVKGALKKKISSDKALSLKLTPTAKLIKTIKRLSPETFLVGFKLESSLKGIGKTLKALFMEAECDLVIANTLKGGYQGYIVNADGEILMKANNKQQIAKNLVKFLL
jgi:phosphopantothenoylcysteine decarboxylase/phosphopantothenate--cysteine ligase